MPDVLQLNDQGTVDDDTGVLHVSFTLNTSEIITRPNGLQLLAEERFVVAIGVDDEHPPTVYVTHFRFLGQPHVLSGYQFCLYLDPSREWDPEYGMNGRPNGVLNRLWRWLNKAAEGGFNASEALYHAVGGLPHISRKGVAVKPIVVRSLPEPHGRVANGWLRHRSDWCLQLEASPPTNGNAGHIPIFFPEHDFPFGAGRDYLIELTTRIDLQHQDGPISLHHLPIADAALSSHKHCGHRACMPTPPRVEARPRKPSTSPALAMLTALAASAARKPAGSPQILLIAVPHPQGGHRHLIAAYFEPALADHLRRLVQTRTSPVISFDHAALDHATPLDWCYLSDERPEVTKRRDIGRPVNAYQGKTVVILGLGGLGAWAAEYVVRAGVSRIIVCDNGLITGGLLVRQNYTDQDVGAPKADRLADRLIALSSEVQVESRHQLTDAQLRNLATEAHVIIDATINRVIARRLNAIAEDPKRTAIIAQIATDARTGTLGLAMIHGLGNTDGVLATDRRTGAVVTGDPVLEPYHVFWRDPDPTDEFVPTRGCSIPTFHGSAADLAGVSASLVTLIAPHLNDGTSGTYLIALPHSGTTPAYKYLNPLKVAVEAT
jgi:ThiF family/Prokaryotic E2 family A